jgi:hypothetical protein
MTFYFSHLATAEVKHSDLILLGSSSLGPDAVALVPNEASRQVQSLDKLRKTGRQPQYGDNITRNCCSVELRIEGWLVWMFGTLYEADIGVMWGALRLSYWPRAGCSRRKEPKDCIVLL